MLLERSAYKGCQKNEVNTLKVNLLKELEMPYISGPINFIDHKNDGF